MTALSPAESTTPAVASPAVGSRLYVIDVPREADHPQLHKLYAQSMPGRITLSLRADPDYRQALDLQGDRHDTVVIRQRDNNRVVAMGSRSVRPLWINGDVQRVGYLSSLRNSPGVRLPRKLVAEAFGWLLARRRTDEADFDLTSILADNHTARRALERGVKGMPRYTPIGALYTRSFRTARPRALAPPLRRLDRSDQPALQSLLDKLNPTAQARPALFLDHSPQLSADRFIGYQSEGRLVAAAMLWDQRPIKQAVVENLSRTLRRWRPAINLGCRLADRPCLPRSGEAVNAVYACHLACPYERPDLLRALLQALRTQVSSLGADTLVVGLTAAQNQHIGRVLRGRSWTTSSMIYAVHRGDPPSFDTRPVWPEVALL